MTLPPELKKEQVCCNNNNACAGGTALCVYAIPSLVVASFLETARKQREAELLSLRNELQRELKEMLMDTSYHQLSIRGKSRPDLMKREAAVRFVNAVFGGERK